MSGMSWKLTKSAFATPLCFVMEGLTDNLCSRIEGNPFGSFNEYLLALDIDVYHHTRQG